MAQINIQNKLGDVFQDDMKPHFDRKADLTGLCRLCLLARHPREMTEIFPSISSDSWKTIIANVTNIEVNFGDGLPALLCNLCVSALNETKEFRDQSATGNNLLQNDIFQPVPAADAGFPCVYKQRDGAADTSCLCRLCAKSFAPYDMTLIFHDNGLDSLPDKIASVTTVKVAVDDGLPARICDCCVAKLLRASEFIEDSIAKDRYLRTELFQVKSEGQLEAETDPLEPDRKPDVMLEPVGTTASLPSKVEIKAEPAGNLEFQDRAVLEAMADITPSSLPEQQRAADPADSQVSGVSLGKQLQDGPNSTAPTTFQCAHCLRKFPSRKSIKKHLPCKILPGAGEKTRPPNNSSKTVAGKDVRPLTCHICRNTYATRDGLYYHFKNVHKMKRQPLDCDQCKQEYTYYASREEHKQLEHKRKSVPCELCGKKFWTEYDRDHHMTAHAEVKADVKKSLQCELCEEKFANKSECSAHMKQHSAAKRPVKKKSVKSSRESKRNQPISVTVKPRKCTTREMSFPSFGVLKSRTTTHSSEKLRFVCTICDRRCLTQSSLASHERVHSDAGPHACDMTFKAASSLKKHSTTPPFVCPECGKSLSSKATYDNHLRLHTGDLPYTCTVCDSSFSIKGNLRIHVKSHEDRVKKFPCHVCNKTLTHKSGLRKHLRRHEERSKPYKCILCPGRYYEVGSLKLHVRMKHANERPFDCGDCGKAFFNKHKLTTHINTHTGYKPFHCEQCEMPFSAKGKLQRHILNIHTYRTLFKCDESECDAEFKLEGSLRKHARSHLGPKPFVCTVCGRACSQKSNLTTHMKMHTGARPHKCPECGKCFGGKQGLKLHSITHTGARPHKCPECDKCFGTRSAMRSHSRTHTGARPHKCPECDKCFSSPDIVRRHLTLHSSSWPHKCPECDTKFKLESGLREHVCARKRPEPLDCKICGRTFTQKGNLKSHMMTHSDERPVKCPKCDKCFKSNKAVKSHLKTHSVE